MEGRGIELRAEAGSAAGEEEVHGETGTKLVPLVQDG